MSQIDVLDKKIRQAAEQLITLRKENVRLAENIRLLEEENKAVKALFGQDGDAWKHDKRMVVEHLERMLKRLNTIKLS